MTSAARFRLSCPEAGRARANGVRVAYEDAVMARRGGSQDDDGLAVGDPSSDAV